MWTIKKIVKKGEYLYGVVPEHPKADIHGYVLAHRIIAENKIKRLLNDDEVAHHINHDKHDNRPENIKIMKRKEHARLHGKIRYPNGRTTKIFICKNCGIKFERYANQSPLLKGYKNTFCSRKCNGIFNGFCTTKVKPKKTTPT